MLGQPPSEWPHLIMLSRRPGLRRRPVAATQRRMKRDGADDVTRRLPPIDLVADFEEYRWLYHESWTPDVERWLLSVVPTAMIFDDHDMIDDWNISRRRGSTTSAPSRGGRSTSSAGWCRTGSTSTSATSIPTEIDAEGMLAELLSQRRRRAGSPAVGRGVRGVHAGARRLPRSATCRDLGTVRRWS